MSEAGGIVRQCALVPISRSSFYYEGTLLLLRDQGNVLRPVEQFTRDSPDGSSQWPTMVAHWASDRKFGPELSR